MSEATQKVRDFLTKSPSVVYPDDVLGLFEQVELENAKLREQGARLFDKTLELATENAKLRELVLDIREGFVTAVDEWKSWELRSCFYDDEKYREYEEQFVIIRQYYDEAMRELGIES